MSAPTLAGTIGVFPPIYLLRLIQDTRVTGRMELIRGSERVDLFVEAGRSVFVRSSGARLRVGEILVRQGELPPEVIELALAVQSDQPGTRIGSMLVESGSVTDAQMSRAVLAVQLQILCDLLLWKEGVFRFIEGEHAPDEDLRLDLDVDRLVIGLLSVAERAFEDDEDRRAA
jgi:hypothetical protein